MPKKVYDGNTGVVKRVATYPLGIIIYMKVWGSYIEIRIDMRIEQLYPSGAIEDYLRRVKSNAEAKKKAAAEGTSVQVKRQPLMPREARTVSLTDNPPETVTPLPYETTI